jgi:hypothetical protein
LTILSFDFERSWWRLFWAFLMKVILSVPDEGYFEHSWWRLFWAFLMKVIQETFNSHWVWYLRFFYLIGLLGFTHSLLHRDICDELKLVDCKAEAFHGNRLYRDNNGKIYENLWVKLCINVHHSICTCWHIYIKCVLKKYILLCKQRT